MTRYTEKDVREAAAEKGIHLATYSPGDGVTRYRFFDRPGNGYFGPDNGRFTALGAREAMTYLAAENSRLSPPPAKEGPAPSAGGVLADTTGSIGEVGLSTTTGKDGAR